MQLSAVLCIALAMATSAFALTKLSNNEYMKDKIQKCIVKSQFTQDQYHKLCTDEEPKTGDDRKKFLSAIECIWTVSGVVNDNKIDADKAVIISLPGAENEKLARETVEKCDLAEADNVGELSFNLYQCFRKAAGDSYKSNCLVLELSLYP